MTESLVTILTFQGTEEACFLYLLAVPAFFGIVLSR
jgi:hypothetical protein